MKELYTCTDCGACGMYEDMGEKIDFCAGHGLPNYVSVKGSKKERLDRLKSSWEMDKKKDERKKNYEAGCRSRHTINQQLYRIYSREGHIKSKPI